MKETLRNGQAFLCIKDVYYTTGSPEKVGKQSFTANKLYYVEREDYLIDDNGIFKNYDWYKENFVASPENDKLKVKGTKDNRNKAVMSTGAKKFTKPKGKKLEE